MSPPHPSLAPLFCKIRTDGFSSAFIPICLYSRNLLRAGQIEKLIREINRFELRVNFVVADYLHGLNMVLRGYRPETSVQKADIAGRQLSQMVHKVIARADARQVSVCRWGEVAREPDFAALHGNVEDAFAATPALRALADEFTAFQRHRTTWQLDEKASAVERRYLYSEIAMSIFMTEIRGLCCELWEEPTRPDGPDPLGEIYRHHLPRLTEWIGRPDPCRTLYHLPASW